MSATLKKLLVEHFGEDLCNRIEHAVFTAGGIEDFDCESDGIALISPAGKFLFVNFQLSELLEIEDAGHLGGLRWQEFCSSAEVLSFLRSHAPTFAASGVWWGRVNARHRSGDVVALNLSLTLLETGHTVCLARTEQAQGARKMRAPEYPDMWAAYGAAAKQQLAHSIGHDFANLMTVISASIEVMPPSAETQNMSDAELDRLGLALVEARRMIGDLQNFPRSDKQARCRDLMPFEKMTKRALLERTGVDCDIRFEEPQVPQFVWSAPSDFLVVLTTIFEHIFRAVPESKISAQAGKLAADFEPVAGFLSKNASYTEISFHLPPSSSASTLCALFTEGGQAWALSGIDSAIFEGLLRDNHAAMSFKDLGGAGYQVSLAWPNRYAPPLVEVERVCAETVSVLKDCRILVVDDSPFMSDFLSKILDDSGALTLAVSKPEDALRIIEQSPHIWSALITDLDMPNLNGLELAKKIRAISQSLPVILVSGHAKIFAERASPFSAVLSKPVVAKELVAAVSAQVAKFKSHKRH
ncbi:response regulator [Planktotalea arctica]|uniref:response regulator n=2 Tax=Planktotalea TaxID=1195766 RepID=UPI000A172104|nr:response regulator [Planktotalea arctica]